MGVYIKGMEMPTNCDECELCTCYVREDGTEENYRCVITFYPIHEFDERHEYCPLVEIPPHGRLIDADILASMCDAPNWCVWLTEIYDAPTIIEAEESGDELSTN